MSKKIKAIPSFTFQILKYFHFQILHLKHLTFSFNNHSLEVQICF